MLGSLVQGLECGLQWRTFLPVNVSAPLLCVPQRLGNEDVDVQGVIAETETLHFENQRRSRHVDQVFEEQSRCGVREREREGEARGRVLFTPMWYLVLGTQ